MKYVVECEKKIKCMFVVDAVDEEECDKKLSAGEYEFKAETTENTDSYLGYRYKDHKAYSGTGNETVICSVNDLCNYLGTTPDLLERDMYKNTDCGMPIAWDDQKVTLCVYAEGADAEWSYDLFFPFTAKEFDSTVETVEEESEQLWHEWNDDDDDDEEV